MDAIDIELVRVTNDLDSEKGSRSNMFQDFRNCKISRALNSMWRWLVVSKSLLSLVEVFNVS